MADRSGEERPPRPDTGEVTIPRPRGDTELVGELRAVRPSELPGQSRRQRAGRGQRVTQAALVLLSGVGTWLMLAPWVLPFEPTGDFAARWMDPVVGALVSSLALARLVWPHPLRWTGPFHASLGVALLLAPSVLSYGGGTTSAAVLTSDVVAGVVIVGLALLTLPAVEGRPTPARYGRGAHRR